MRFHTIRKLANLNLARFDITETAPPANDGEEFLPNATSVYFRGTFMYITFVYVRVNH